MIIIILFIILVCRINKLTGRLPFLADRTHGLDLCYSDNLSFVVVCNACILAKRCVLCKSY